MDDSISYWIDHLKRGDAAAAERLWRAYFERLTGYARARLGRFPRRASDEEDVAVSVFDSLCRGAATGRYPRLSDRQDLWSLLVVMTSRKVCDVIATERAQKRGGGQVRVASELHADPAAAAAAFEAVLSREPTPEMAAVFEEACQGLLGRLDPDLRRLALLRLDGESVEEIAATLGCGVRTVERRLGLIRRIWQEADRANG